MKGLFKVRTWDYAFDMGVEEAENVYVLTKSGLEYQTNELIYSLSDDPHELFLIDAKLVQRNDEFKITNIKELNSDVFIDGIYIERVFFEKSEVSEDNG